MAEKQKITQELHDELVRLFGEDEAKSLIDDNKHSNFGLQYMAFKKQFRKNFGINFNIILTTFIIIGIFLITLQILGL